MKSDLDVYRTTMPKTRQASYYLSCLNSSVFMDFNRSDLGTIYLVRISFDGFGCCSLKGTIKHLNLSDSELFINTIEKETLDQTIISTLIKKAISINSDLIWADAIEKYGLIDN